MTNQALMVDLYQLATILGHQKVDPKRLDQRVQMSFFSRKMPNNRNYLMFVGLRSILEHMRQFDHGTIGEMLWNLSKHPMIGAKLAENADLFHWLNFNDFNLMSMQEGTVVYAAPGYRLDGRTFKINDKHINVYEPYMQVNTNFLLSKLIETSWLSYINYESMVASKAARVVSAADGKPVLEFGQRRTHPLAAIDAAYAAYIAGCAGTSNVAAFAKYGIPAVGTMDHFAIMASVRENGKTAKEEAEKTFFNAFTETFPEHSTLLVDTYDTQNGIMNAIIGTNKKLKAIRIDSNVSVESVKRARALLDAEDCQHVKIFVSDGLNEQKVQELSPYVDGFGVGENITCSPDAATGVGAVGKLIVNGYGQNTIKLSSGSGKLTLPGPVQVWREKEYDTITLLGETANGYPLLENIGRTLPSVEQTRQFAASQLKELTPECRSINTTGYIRKIYVSDRFAELTTQLVNEE